MKILIADSSERVRKTLIKYLDLENNFDIVFETQTVEEAQRVMENIKIEVVLLNLQSEDKSGLEMIEFSKSQHHKPLVILCSTYGNPLYGSVYEKTFTGRLFNESSELLKLKKFIKALVKDENHSSSHELFN